jgi:hypothetical protein
MGLVVLCLVAVLSTSASAVPVTPGGVVISGQMYWEGDGVSPYWVDLSPGVCTTDTTGDPQGGLFSFDDSRGREIGVLEGIYELQEGSYESLKAGFVGHTVRTLDLTIQSVGSGGWLGSQNLLFEIRSPYSNDVHWTWNGAFSSEPVNAYVQLPSPQWGYEFRLTVVPDASPLVVLLTGLSAFGYRSRRSLKGRDR